MDFEPIMLHGPAQAEVPLVLDSPHSGTRFPPDFGAAVSDFDLRDGEDCFVDELYLPATEFGVPLLAAQFPRTYIDANRHAGDIDLELVEGGRWPFEHVPSGKHRIGKALVWRTLDDGRAIYDRKLRVEEIVGRIERCHAPYHGTLVQMIEAVQRRFGTAYHINCHSMPHVGGKMGEGGEGRARADFVLGDRDGSTCAPEFTAEVARVLRELGYSVAINDPYKGVELVRAYSDPARGRHSLQLEINKRLYMDEAARSKHAGFDRLQADLMTLVRQLVAFAQGQRA
jgi:N-formylglutamate amidohydrolase